MAILDKIKKLTFQLLPTGRAFRMPFGGDFQKLSDGLAESEKRLYDDGRSLLDSMLPDNSNFTTADATRLERIYGLITNPAVSLADRKLAITRKINHPGAIKGRQHFLFLERELQAAGFDVYVHENIFSGLRTTATQLAIDNNNTFEHGEFEHGEFEHGDYLLGSFISHVANRINEGETVIDGPQLSNIFFIGGEVAGTFADVDSNRHDEFRQLILRVKPGHLIAYLFIDYV